jgi:hypothetical protein
MPLVRIACCIIRQAREPVFIGHRLFRYRYSLYEQGNRFRPTDIRVSGVTTLELGGSGYSDQRSASVKGLTTYGIGAAYSHFLRDSQFPQRNTHFAKRYIHTLNMPESKPFERLPKSVVPKHYNLQLKPDLKTFVFEGQETVNVEVSYGKRCVLSVSMYAYKDCFIAYSF